jgi:Peptide-N-glycosidase F, C terminal/Secretion system C-terminal sorting domain/Peptide-N-glycosidase F, N terminal
MKKTLLTLSFAALFGLQANAQSSTSLQLYDDAVFYNMYGGLVQNEPLPEGAIRLRNTTYARPLTDDQIATFGNTLTLNVTAASLCDNYDRIGNVNLAFLPAGTTSYEWADAAKRIELGRFITPFMVPDGDVEVPYTWDISQILYILNDATLAAEYDFFIEFEIAGYQGSATQGGAAYEYPSICADREDVYRGSLELVSSGTYEPENVYFKELSFKYELKDYTLDGTDELGETVKSYDFDVPATIYGAKYFFINSNHGSNSGGEEYIRRWHYIYLDGVEMFKYRPGGVSCVPFFQYNTQPNCIYYLCDGTNNTRPDTNSAWSWNNWCPGDKIPTREIDLGTVAAGTHTYKIDVPAATFAGDQGYFPMSVYVFGYYDEAAGADTFKATQFTVSPNPVNDIATITTNGETVKAVSVTNTLGQVVLTGNSNTINLSALQSGVYVVKVSFDNNTTGVQKIIKN